MEVSDLWVDTCKKQESLDISGGLLVGDETQLKSEPPLMSMDERSQSESLNVQDILHFKRIAQL
jgi:hypothetical protein